MNYSALCHKTIEIVYQASEILKENFGKINHTDIEFKGKNDLVSFVDRETENFLKSKLSDLIPESGFLAEESGLSDFKDTDYLWIIDPLDGTTNYLHHLPLYSVSVALQENNETVIGIVYEVVNDEMFYSYKGGNAMLNGERISVSATADLQNALLATGFPIKNFEIIDDYLRIFRNLVTQTRGIRRLGTAAVDLAYVACGRFDGFFEYNLSPWDVAAGEFIVRQAGGSVSDFSGKNNFLYGRQILAANSLIFNELLKNVISDKD
ncbi:MAG: inositol monophosphatase [Sphingobacteriales bacterium]|nr:inositol monophosphatase [Sphingobacteriales bacterium]